MKSKNDRIRQALNMYCYLIVAMVSFVLLTASFSLALEGNSKEITDKAIVPDDRYIVRFRNYVEDHPAVARALARRHRFATGHIYRRVLKGFSARFPAKIKQILERRPDIAYIERDRKFYTTAQTIPTGIDRMDAELRFTGTDADVDIAIIDTGIDLDHPDLKVAGSTNCARFGGCLDGGGNDGHGHGTHVAGTAAAMHNNLGVVGVAPGARLWAVRVLNNNGSGWTSWIIAGIDWVTEHADTIEVANMSLGGQGFSNAMREAIQESVAQGVVYIVSAGNDSRDIYGSDGRFGTSDDFVPAAYPEVATISAFADSDGSSGGTGPDTSRGPDDSFASFSNFSGSVTAGNPVTSPGAAIDLMCPGVDIFSTYRNGQYATFSGTSMASPHAAGLAALWIAQNGRASDAAGVYTIRQALIDAGVDQGTAGGLALANDPDPNPERLGFAGSVEPIIDLSVVAVEAPESVVVGDIADITVTVRNVGTEDVTDSIEVNLVYDDVISFETQTIDGLAVGQSAELIFEWDTEGVQEGFYTLTATVAFDDENASNNDMAVEMEVRLQGLPDTIHIGDLDGSSRYVFWTIWAARVTMAIHDTDHNPVPAATVYGVFSDGPSVFQCTTNSNGQCSVVGYQWFLNALTFTVTDVYHVDLDYEPADNHDPEGDSNGTSITVFRP
jgi:subtilisin family serine protease